jgi:hypothetical protein
MPLTYLDQNALINLGRRAREKEFRKKLDVALKGSLSVVMSPWHLIETAHTKKQEAAIELAEFIDSLRPQWLLDRRDIAKIEVAADFFAFAGIKYSPPVVVTTRSAAFAVLNGQPDAQRFNVPAPAFVKQWLEHPEQLEPLEKPYKDNVESLIRLRELQKEGKITAEVRQRSDRKLLEQVLPSRTPEGLDFGRDLPQRYLDQARVGAIPVLAIETAISEHEWDANGGVDRNTLLDKFHLSPALHYVDEIVSDDGFFHKIYPVTSKTGHVKAKLIRNEEFLGRF